MLPSVGFCGLDVTRLIIGANPFGGYSHQNKERDQEMVSYHTVDRIKETWARAEASGINTMITNNESPNVIQAVNEYLSQGGSLQWITQVNGRGSENMFEALDKAVDMGCRALYIHGGRTDECYANKDARTISAWCDHARSRGVPVGVAGHAPEVHRWVDALDITDFHAVCFFNCGSLHSGEGERFRLGDIGPAVACVQQIRKPCIGYKIMGSGRLDPHMAFEFAFESIKSTDVVNVGMHRGDKEEMVEENAAIVEMILRSERFAKKTA